MGSSVVDYADQRRGTLEQLVVPSSLRPDVLASLHDDMGHRGYERTMELLRPCVFWPAVCREVRTTPAAASDALWCHALERRGYNAWYGCSVMPCVCILKDGMVVR